MLNVFKRLFKTQKEEKIHPLLLSNEELTEIFREQQVCPDCGVWDFREGPSGGMSINIYCANCGSWFNEQGPFGLDRIFKENNFSWRNQDKLLKGEKYCPYTWDILKTWYRVDFELESRHKKKESIVKCVEWCGNDNTEGKWSVKDFTIYCELESDAIAIKMII